MADEKRWAAMPGNGTRFHIFGDKGRSLCGGWLYLPPEYDRDPISDKSRWMKGQDCKDCFRKAGLIPVPEEV